MPDGSGGVEAVVAAWRASAGPEEATAFAREVVARCRPPSPARARSLLWSCARLGAFGIEAGLAPVAEVLLHPSTIERFVVVGLAGAPTARRRSMRANLRFVARRVGTVAMAPDPVPLGRSRAQAPYSAAELDAFLALAAAQPTQARRMRLGALVCLGAGAGLGGADMRHVRGTHVEARHGGVVVVVDGGRAPRVVPVLGRFHAPLLEAADFAGDGFIIGGVAAGRHNVTNRLVASIDGGRDLPRLRAPRLRATWLAAASTAVGLPALLAAAGVSHSQQLADVAAALPVPPEAELVALLGGGG